MDRKLPEVDGCQADRSARLVGSWILRTIAAGVLSLASGCGRLPEKGATELSEVPVGLWVSDVDGLLFDLQEGGSFTVTPPAPRQPVNGSWTLAGDRIEFRNDAEAAVCAEVVGIYRWSLESEKLDFTLVEDGCEPRVAHMAGIFTRAPSAE
jgi:hypothetical protein